MKRRDFIKISGLGVTAAAGVHWITSARADLEAEKNHAPETVLVEAEAFVRPGGWVLDQQSINPMGSAYLLAHGLGHPVEDAVTTVRLPASGEYRLFVRTRDWVAPWKTGNTPAAIRASGSPGRFQVLVDGQPIPHVFGEQGAEWHWEEAGTVNLSKKNIVLSLHDLTGFDGRCEAILLTRDASFQPPETMMEGRTWRDRLLGFPAEPEAAGSFDLLVAGGGVAGICAAISAARLGIKVALVHNRPVLGGNLSSEIRISPLSVRNIAPYSALGNVLGEFDWNKTIQPTEADVFKKGDAQRLALVQAEPNITLFLNHHVCGVVKHQSSIKAVEAMNTLTGRRIRLDAALFADCTGDANLGFLAGADWRMGREGRAETGEPRAPEKADAQVLGSTLHWYTNPAASPGHFPDCPWALPFTEEKCLHAVKGSPGWETGFDLDQANQTELIRDHMLRAIYGNWAFQKNHSAQKERYAGLELAWVGHVLGKRESRRLLGDVIYSQLDLQSGTAYPDGFVACNWGIDIHVAEPQNQRQFAGWAFRSIAEHYDKYKAPMRWLPYRCLYSHNVDNLFMAGRNVSCTHLAFAWFRCQRTTGMMGEVVGMAAALCRRRRTAPREIYQKHLDELKQMVQKGVGKPRSIAKVEPLSPMR